MRARRLLVTVWALVALALGAMPESAYGASYNGLTRSAIISSLGTFGLVSAKTVSDGHGGTLTAAEGISPSNPNLSRFMFWHGMKMVRAFNLFASAITRDAPNRITLRVGDILLANGRTSYRYLTFAWNGHRLLASAPLPRQAAISPPSVQATVSQPGFLGVQIEDPPTDWTVTGCEIAHVIPGTPAASAGLIGAQDRIDPVGDVIYGLELNGSYVAINDCSNLTSALDATHPGESVLIYLYHRVVTLFIGSWTAETTTALLGTQPCPPAITGSITSSFLGNRINLSIELVGKFGTSQAMTAIFDTGGVNTYVPNELLQKLGFVPFMTTVGGGVVPGAADTVYLYRIPASALLVQDNGNYVPLASGELTVMGIPGLQFAGVGPDILKHGASFSASGSAWSLTPACNY